MSSNTRVVRLHALAASAERPCREADGHDASIQTANDVGAGAAALLFEAWDQLQHRREIGVFRRRLRHDVLHARPRLDAEQRKALANEFDERGVDVDRGVGGVRHEAHPRRRERIQSAADVDQRSHGADAIEERFVEAVDVADALGGRGVQRQDRAQFAVQCFRTFGLRLAQPPHQPVVSKRHADDAPETWCGCRFVRLIASASFLFEETRASAADRRTTDSSMWR